MPESCSGFNCTARFKVGSGITFHRFPFRDPVLLSKWIQASRRDDWQPSKHSALCSQHFEEKWFYTTNGRRRLLNQAVPTIFHFNDQIKKKRGRKRKKQPEKAVPEQSGCKSGPVKKCAYVNCKSNSWFKDEDHMRNVFFLPVPSMKSCPEERKIWLEASGRLSLGSKSGSNNFKYYICSNHFVDKKGPTTSHPNPIPYDQVEDSTFIKMEMDNETEELETEAVDTTDVFTTMGKNRKEFDSDVITPSASSYTVICPATDLPCSTPQRYSLNDIRRNYHVPLNWILCVRTDAVIFAQINDKTDSLLMKFIIYEDMTTQLQALGRPLHPSHPVLQTFPANIDNSLTLGTCLFNLRLWHPCIGNNERAFVSLLLEEKSLSGHHSPRTGAVHSLNCTLLTKNRSKRCMPCKKLRAGLHISLQRYLKNFNIYLESPVNHTMQLNINAENRIM